MMVADADGAGRAGSRVCRALAQAGGLPVRVDDLEYGHLSAVTRGPPEIGRIEGDGRLRAATARYRPGAVPDGPDGTTIRDSMQVADLAGARLRAPNRLRGCNGCAAVNPGVAQGPSVPDVTGAVNAAPGFAVPYPCAPGRRGDPEPLPADGRRARARSASCPRYDSPGDLVETACRWHGDGRGAARENATVGAYSAP